MQVLYYFEKKKFQSCYMELDSGETIQCTEFEYDTSLFASTIITEWDLVCSKSYYIEVKFVAIIILNF